MNSPLLLETGRTVATRPNVATIQNSASTPAQKKLQSTAKQLVTQAFFAPMLQQMRNSPFKDDKFSGGRGGEAFNQMLDQQMVQHLSGPTDRIANSIAKKLGKDADSAARREEASAKLTEEANVRVAHGNYKAATHKAASDKGSMTSKAEAQRTLAKARALQNFSQKEGSNVDIAG